MKPDISKKFLLLLVLAGLLFPRLEAVSLEDFLREMPVTEIRPLEKEGIYSDIYEIFFDQYIDHNDPSKGTFKQKLYISHVSDTLPVVLVTEGYSADYYYTSEPAGILNCNQIIAEHRFFGESKPDSMNWEYLSTWQAASDHHEIIEHFKKYYTGKWITTGISKGGQTVMYHSYYYPYDVSVRIPYVAPLNNCKEDKRIYEFLDEVGSFDCRNKIHKFQTHLLKHQEKLIPVFKKFSEKKGYTYELAGGYEKAFEYCVLEYSFAFWQWGYADCFDIPGRNATAEEVIQHMNMVGGFDYFADQFILEYQPFFYQAYKEMGYYGYELGEFKKYLKHVDTPGFEFTLPEGVDMTFDHSILVKLDNYFKESAENYIFIYGEYDTWSATAVDPGENENISIFYKKKGTHRTRVRNMPLKQQEEIKYVLQAYLN